MSVRCIVIDAYRSPGSPMTQGRFNLQRDWIDYVYGVPNTFWGGQSPNHCGFIIRFRFRDDQNTPVMAVHGPIVPQNEFFPVGPGGFDALPDWAQAGLTRPNGPGPFGTTNENDIAVYYLNGPLAEVDENGDFIRFVDGYAPIITPNGPAIIMSNSNAAPGRGLILAHELGHALGLSHVDDINNLMSPVVVEGTSFNLTCDQCDQAAESPYFQTCPRC
ncbi:matrixin family metalloprotease [Bacillus cereus]|uniref:matrixin family metalloprotease n=1 Tax=Bacillus cereus TaxID=1396 RepID=UPI00356E4151